MPLSQLAAHRNELYNLYPDCADANNRERWWALNANILGLALPSSSAETGRRFTPNEGCETLERGSSLMGCRFCPREPARGSNLRTMFPSDSRWI